MLSGANLRLADLREADLSGAHLYDSILSEANLSRAKLDWTQLRHADLCDANIQWAEMYRAQLQGANLSGAYLRGTNLHKANLCDASLHGVCACKADLSSTNLRRATLNSAQLGQANLRGADLRGTDLDDADLSYANLEGANLQGASLRRANLLGTQLAETIFGNTYLASAINLNSCWHRGPSTIDHRTIEISGGLPDAFLRGCGFPDNLIEYIPSLLAQPMQYYSCFISYSSADEEFVKRLHADLQANGVRCWFAPKDMKIGDKIRERIADAIRIHDKLLIILSNKSVKSDWVETEVERAFSEERNRNATVLFPVRLDGAVLSSSKAWASQIFDTRHVGDFTGWKYQDRYREAFDRLLRDLKHALETKSKIK